VTEVRVARVTLGFATIVAVVCCVASSESAHAQLRARVFHSRPDLRPPPVQILLRTRRVTPGYIFIAPKKRVAQAGPLILDNHGRVVWFLPLDARGATDFRVQRYRGRPVLTWWQGRSADGRRLGRYSIYDDRYRPIAYVRPGNGLAGDMHEFTITRRNTALITLSHVVRVKSRKVLEGAFQEVDIKSGRVLFEWHSIGQVPLVESYYRLPRNPAQTFDYFHINSIDVDTDGNLLVSSRNTHTIYKINRRTGKIIWRLGGKHSDFALGADARFGWQHDARRQPNGTLTLFDNAAAPRLRKQSRGLVLRLDEKRMRVAVVHTFVHDPPILAVDQGNMQRLANGHYLVGWGHQPYFTEFGPHGGTVLDARFAGGGADSYRAYRFPWIGRPARPPSVAIAGNIVYVSWNGATEVKDWQLLAGVERNRLHPVHIVPKRTFETAIPLPSGAAWVAVRALDRRGRSLARSEILGRD
jgi:hypothetical protein